MRSWIENSDVLSLFPALVWKIQLRADVHEPIDASTLGLLDALRQGLPALMAGVIRPPVTELTAVNTDQVVVRIKNGTLLVFPAYLQHSVDANASSESRVSVSFNLMFSAFTAELSKPLWGEK
ncbi:MAG: putative 2OG-Fe(II) oxygenase [Burkholderiales bacterium]